MKSQVVAIFVNGKGMNEALAMTEIFGTSFGLDKKPVLHLRLLAEELVGLLRGIAGEVVAYYWITAEDKSFELHMKSDVQMTEEMQEQFLAASSSGKNEATKSFMGKIRTMIAEVMASAGEALPYAMVNTAYAYQMGSVIDENASVWSMAAYRKEVEKRVDDSTDAKEAWDELEKSIVANIADDVKVRIMGRSVEITVYKAF